MDTRTNDLDRNLAALLLEATQQDTSCACEPACNCGADCQCQPGARCSPACGCAG